MPPADSLHPISLATAAVLTGRSMRTWQRRIEEGAVPRLGDGRGALVPFSAVRPALALALTDEEVRLLVRADQGDGAAQAEVGARFALAALQEAEAGRGGDALVAPDAAGGGGGGGGGGGIGRACQLAQAALHLFNQSADHCYSWMCRGCGRG